MHTCVVSQVAVILQNPDTGLSVPIQSYRVWRESKTQLSSLRNDTVTEPPSVTNSRNRTFLIAFLTLHFAKFDLSHNLSV